MSELTRCNYCTLQEVRRRHPDAVVTTKPDEYGWLQVWIDDKPGGQHFLALTDHCVC